MEREGAYVTVRAELPPFDHPPVEIGLGVLRPGMARTAGQVADAAITWLAPAAYLRDVLVPALEAGARERGRAAPRVVSVLHAALTRPGRDPYLLAYACSHNHLGAPHYTDMLRRAGLAVDPADPRAGARALVDGGVFASGGPGEVADAVAALRAAGADEVVVNVSGVAAVEGFRSALRDLEEILEAVAGRPGAG
ncbi:LLM class flavin-dependent oxidoreductase [Streptantibioticus cattleyicolor]|uniref:Luciferase-like domain-containing protein n=1 Tax=Streptantibioticus cattleyicolor (strain ATCC 35852 / DSM 46488 / JCM 4925 / NBRC 14057 / NRRL 8057) TaxID=1003195 RepID=F8JJZ2_STREN|nr:LLM class flavin-dependent oxidoreductase [Streptantibioticus cattleyicolor]AEW98574.1 hypothetical protein SCATT_p03810 [Streptantibioticus cattleyicolor NRRL 8057 = DSM 46488]CCB72367.1 conserved protein of unknown function [Streptantibioticus cattleyicolor NRRL 8057 = DSM 46488]